MQYYEILKEYLPLSPAVPLHRQTAKKKVVLNHWTFIVCTWQNAYLGMFQQPFCKIVFLNRKRSGFCTKLSLFLSKNSKTSTSAWIHNYQQLFIICEKQYEAVKPSCIRF